MPWPRVVVAAAPSSCAHHCNPQRLARAGGVPWGCLPYKGKWDVAGLIPLFPAQMGMAEQV